MSGINSPKFKLLPKRMQKSLIKERRKLIVQLKKLNVKVNSPFEMSVEDLKLLVNCHRKTVEAKRKSIKSNQSKSDVKNREKDLNRNVDHALNAKAERAKRRKKRIQLLLLINRLEEEGKMEQVFALEKELAKL